MDVCGLAPSNPLTLTTYRCRWPQLDLYQLHLQNSEVPATRETHT